jgi:hypothetical protein
MSITSKIDICNMTLSLLGNSSTVADIDTPTEPKETTFAIWYDVARKYLLRTYAPNFAKKTDSFAQIVDAGNTRYSYGYQIPKKCLLVLGVGTIPEKRNNYSVEGGILYSNEDYTDGVPVRYIEDIEDITKWPPEAQIFLAWVIAKYVVWPITQDSTKVQLIARELPAQASEFTSVNTIENKPVLISNSLFEASRYAHEGRVYDEKK